MTGKKSSKKTVSREKSQRGRALLLSAASIPAIASVVPCQAQGPEAESEIRFSYYSYRDWQEGKEHRIDVNAPMAWFRSPLGGADQIEGSFVLDSVSGASPLYHNTLSGASGRGIEDERLAGDVAATHFFERFSLTAGMSISSEDDYKSRGGSLESSIWSSDKNTIFNIGISGSSDEISSTNAPNLDESMQALGFGVGVTQILDPDSAMQFNITYASKDGFLSDPYKSFDLRPQSRETLAALTRYIRYFEDYDASLHVDHRYFRDTWGIISHTAELRWFQPAGDKWIITPGLRYYSQSKADFYSNFFPPEDPAATFFSADQRLAGFGSISGGLEVSRKLADKVTANLSFDYMLQDPGLKIGSPGSAVIGQFHAAVIGVGLWFKF